MFTISSWKDIRKNNVYKLFNYIIKIIVLQLGLFVRVLSFYGRNNHPLMLAIRRIVENFESTFSLYNVQVPIRQRTARNNKNIAVVQASVSKDRNLSIPRRSQELGLP